MTGRRRNHLSKGEIEALRHTRREAIERALRRDEPIGEYKATTRQPSLPRLKFLERGEP